MKKYNSGKELLSNRYTNIILKLWKDFFPEYSFYTCISIKEKQKPI